MSVALYDPWNDVEERYKVRIMSNFPPLIGVVGLLPQTFTEEVASDWKSPYGGLFAAINQGYAAVKLLTGLPNDVVLQFKAQSTQFWSNASPLRINGLKFLFLARKDAKTDVVEPSRALQGLCAPRAGSGLSPIKPPSEVSLEIGFVLFLESAIVKSVGIQWHAPLDLQGIPTSAEVTLAVETRQAYVIDAEENYVKTGTGWEVLDENFTK